MTYTSLANDVIRVMNHHKIMKSIIIGHSMGGKTAMATSLLYP